MKRDLGIARCSDHSATMNTGKGLHPVAQPLSKRAEGRLFAARIWCFYLQSRQKLRCSVTKQKRRGSFNAFCI